MRENAPLQDRFREGKRDRRPSIELDLRPMEIGMMPDQSGKAPIWKWDRELTGEARNFRRADDSRAQHFAAGRFIFAALLCRRRMTLMTMRGHQRCRFGGREEGAERAMNRDREPGRNRQQDDGKPAESYDELVHGGYSIT